MTPVRSQAVISVLMASAALFLAISSSAEATDCPVGTVKIGEKRTETADAILVQPICKRIAAIPTSCPPGSSVVGSRCMKDTAMRPEPSKEQKLVALRRRSKKELDEVRFHGFVVAWEGIWTLLSRAQVSDASSTAEDESNEMSEHVRTYLELQEKIEELTGGKATAQRLLAERESHIKYVRADGSYTVYQSKAPALGENYLPDNQTPLKATEPIPSKSYTPGDVSTPPPLKDSRPIPPNGDKPEKDPTVSIEFRRVSVS